MQLSFYVIMSVIHRTMVQIIQPDQSHQTQPNLWSLPVPLASYTNMWVDTLGISTYEYRTNSILSSKP